MATFIQCRKHGKKPALEIEPDFLVCQECDREKKADARAEELRRKAEELKRQESLMYFNCHIHGKQPMAKLAVIHYYEKDKHRMKEIDFCPVCKDKIMPFIEQMNQLPTEEKKQELCEQRLRHMQADREFGTCSSMYYDYLAWCQICGKILDSREVIS